MYCMQCGEIAVEGAGFCAKCGSALATGRAAPQGMVAAVAVQPGESFRWIRIMNYVGAIGFVFVGLLLIAAMHGKVPEGRALLLSFFYVLVLATPVATIFALSDEAGKGLRILAITLNAGMMVLWCIGMVGSFSKSAHSIFTHLFSVVFYVVPEWINLRALLALLKGARVDPAGNDGLAP